MQRKYGPRQVEQGALLPELSIEEFVPVDHALRTVDRFVDPSGVRSLLVPFYSMHGRPSIDPDLMIRKLLLGNCRNVRSKRRLRLEIQKNLVCRWFSEIDLTDPIPDHATCSKSRLGRFRERRLVRHLLRRSFSGASTRGWSQSEFIESDRR